MNKCLKCGKTFEFQYLLKKHENRKRACDTINNIESIYKDKINRINNDILLKTNNSKNKCEFCNIKLSNKSSLIRHIKYTCNIKQLLENEIDKLIEEKKQLLEQQKRIIYKDKNIETLQNQISELQKNQIITTVEVNNINNS